MEPGIKQAARRFHRELQPLYLPGDNPPEEWIYQTLEANAAKYAQVFGAPNLEELLAQLRQQFDGAADKPTNIIKARYATLADAMQRTPEDIARVVGREESAKGLMKIFADQLIDAITDWRSRAGGH